ncbi:phosphotransferase enzyme family protein [Neolewinella litorea]|uniref:Aminoglycoside phosphotransferase family protein n=1 Tax=Neolewinella litorea TaxID=2562452 RepID=A0A4S4NDY3_9BACT|nr:aminoglycoside phosphotransferase family protein [Neolewinella litorea]THH37724.1 aminoglycoside phosphotransferase family protein [Neolewinella litorea]
MHEIAQHFRLDGTIASIEAFGGGHINDTFRIRNGMPGGPDYLLQRINHRVFPDVKGLMENIVLVTDHLRGRIAQAPPPANEQTTLTVVRTRTGDPYHRTPDGNYWRVFLFLDTLHAYDLVATPAQAYEGARSYGYFLRFLDDFPAARLTEVIPGFHDLARRLRAFEAARAQPVNGRERACPEAIRQVVKMADDLLVINRLHKEGQIRQRVTHNDTKFNNVLLTPDDRGKCVIDLDTVMPGIVHFDFGDAVRSGIGTANEDEADLSKVTVDMDKFRAFTAGYLEVTRDVLSPLELRHLGLSGAYMTFIMGVRFLTDYLSGDVYYKITSPDHNLRRARNQLRLTREFLDRLPELDEVVRTS